MHLVEAWERGMPKILHNAPNVSFKEEAGLFITSFARINYCLKWGLQLKGRCYCYGK